MKTPTSISSSSSGTLYIVATPLGNLGDITFRAIEILKKVDLIAAEDTRHSARLLNHYGITTRLISCHDHNEKHRTPQLIEYLNSGQNIALISDAGTPTISDPGYNLVAETSLHGISVVPIPGCSAAIAGLSVSGLPTDSFYFHGFLPKKKNKQKQTLESLKQMPATLIFYESPKRIINLIKQIINVMGDRNACLAREITKTYEEFLRGPLTDILKQLEEKQAVKGEISLFISSESNMEKVPPDSSELEAIIKKLTRETSLSTSALAKKISDQYHIPKGKVYNFILELKKQPSV